MVGVGRGRVYLPLFAPSECVHRHSAQLVGYD